MYPGECGGKKVTLVQELNIQVRSGTQELFVAQGLYVSREEMDLRGCRHRGMERNLLNDFQMLSFVWRKGRQGAA